MSGSSWVPSLRRVARGDQEAFAFFCHASSPLAYRVARRILQNHADAEDAVIDAYMQMWNSAASFDCDRGHPATWVAMIVRSRALDQIRRRSRLQTEDGGAFATIAASGPTPAGCYETTQAAGMLRSELDRLPADCRRVLDLAYFDGMSQREIAARLNEPLGTVKSRTRRALKLMREGMADCRDLGWAAG